MLYLLNPWGLLALSSLGVIVFLYFYVFRGRRREVSSLFLWQTSQTQRQEGVQRKRPPLTLPLILELIAATLLSMIIASAGCYETAERPHAVVILDASASMSAGKGSNSFRQRAIGKVRSVFNRLGNDGRVTLISSAYGGKVMGQKAMPRRKALSVLEEWHPAAPSHNMRPAVEVARAMAGDQGDILFITDHSRQVSGVNTIAVGETLPNTAWVNSHWRGRTELFALAKHFGPAPDQKQVTMFVNGEQVSQRRIDFTDRKAVPLTFQVPEGADKIRLSLPDDALNLDNHLRLSTPRRPKLHVEVGVEKSGIKSPLLRAIRAETQFAVQREKPFLIHFGAFAAQDQPPSPQEAMFEVLFRIPNEKGSNVYNGPYVTDPFHALTRGLQLEGVLWRADPDYNPDTATTLVSAGETPLITLDDRRITLNVNPQDTDIFRRTAWPVFVANVLRYAHRNSPGLKQHSYRIGETLSFYAPDRWDLPLTVIQPEDERVTFDQRHVYFGKLKQPGVYKIRAGGTQVTEVDANLLNAAESDLTDAKADHGIQQLRADTIQAGSNRTFHAEFAAAAILCLLGCWFVLERRR